MGFQRRFYTKAPYRSNERTKFDQSNYNGSIQDDKSIAYATLSDFIYIREKEMEVQQRVIQALKQLPEDMLFMPIAAFDSYVSEGRRDASDTLHQFFDHILQIMDVMVTYAEENAGEPVSLRICRLNRDVWTPKRLPNKEDEEYIKEAVPKFKKAYEEWLKFVEIDKSEEEC